MAEASNLRTGWMVDGNAQEARKILLRLPLQPLPPPTHTLPPMHLKLAEPLNWK